MTERKARRVEEREGEWQNGRKREREKYTLSLYAALLSLPLLTLLSQLVFIAAAYVLVRIKFLSLSGWSRGYSLPHSRLGGSLVLIEKNCQIVSVFFFCKLFV